MSDLKANIFMISLFIIAILPPNIILLNLFLKK